VTTDNDGLADNNDKSITVAFNDRRIQINDFESDDNALVAYNSSGDGKPLGRGTPLGAF
jgi:hypothetical protein